jgi:hypothetical protein
MPSSTEASGAVEVEAPTLPRDAGGSAPTAALSALLGG